MYQTIIIIHVLVGLTVIGLVLMQQGRGADAGAAFGSGSSGSVFGAQGSASFLSRTTAVFAFIFFSTSLALAVLGGQLGEKKDVMDETEIEQVMPDIPIVIDEEPMRVPSISEQQAQEEVPAIVTEPSSLDSFDLIKPIDDITSEDNSSTQQSGGFENAIPLTSE
jgi:preprotein translocase subunit SecG